MLACCTFSAFGQQNYSVEKIDPSLIKNADAVIRENQVVIEVEAIDEVTIKTFRVVTVFNESGDSYTRALEFYDESSKINEQEAIIYDSRGEEVDKIKSRDFKDQSNFDSFILFSDNRVSYLNYTPRQYPYTVAYTSEVETNNSVFLPDWFPMEGYDVSVEKSSYRLLNPGNIPLRSIERNFQGFEIANNNTKHELEYHLTNAPAVEYEILSPSLKSFVPRLLVALDKFHLEGVDGVASNWEEMGKWMYDELVAEHDQIPAATIQKVTNLTSDASTIEEKARRIYQYVQDNTRYIAVMYGIGGWEPALAADVDRLGYGDCKALTNYTMALLKSQGIESYYSVVYGGEKRNIDPEFTKMQGNHVILNIPNEKGEDFWLECTSQEDPFNYLGDFTDDRYVLRVKPDGGELVKTRRYSEDDNLQKTKCEIELDGDGNFTASLERSSFGVPYGEVYRLESKTEKDRKEYYLDEWSRFQNITFSKIDFENRRDTIEFRESIDFSGARLATKAGKRLLLPLSFIQQEQVSLGKNEDRKRPVKLLRGRSYEDDFVFMLPEGFQIETLPENKILLTEYGQMSIEISSSENDGKESIHVKRKMKIREGEWEAEKYPDFRKFIYNVNHLNGLKAVIVQSNT
ncbi:DUF3857 domain-containing protein [Gramella sp. GC03-9]|uniref:DUF3857 domain-containing protein n=1 Tax=Christiangramia oceanisediminis TaxID=2920386 RepID=A0A9X2I9J3_9FLAO|nr:DUF3857 domain-containing protein [Gramella oceanisediminis]MCP9198498.1 DUF3857 domain-containing protein [Gramella oceanisediminis]